MTMNTNNTTYSNVDNHLPGLGSIDAQTIQTHVYYGGNPKVPARVFIFGGLIFAKLPDWKIYKEWTCGDFERTRLVYEWRMFVGDCD